MVMMFTPLICAILSLSLPSLLPFPPSLPPSLYILRLLPQDLASMFRILMRWKHYPGQDSRCLQSERLRAWELSRMSLLKWRLHVSLIHEISTKRNSRVCFSRRRTKTVEVPQPELVDAFVCTETITQSSHEKMNRCLDRAVQELVVMRAQLLLPNQAVSTCVLGFHRYCHLKNFMCFSSWCGSGRLLFLILLALIRCLQYRSHGPYIP